MYRNQENEAVVETKRPLSKYAAKRAKRIIDLRGESVKIEKKERPQKQEIPNLKDMIKNQLYTREGGEAFAKGNPFAIAFNEMLNR